MNAKDNLFDNSCRAAIARAEARAKISVGIENQLAELKRLDTKKRFVELSVFPLLWLLGAAIILLGYNMPTGVAHYALRIIGTVLSATALNAFVLLMHEGMHHLLFASKFLNRLMSVVLGGTTFVSYTAYKVLHFRHHNYLGDHRDPDDYHNYTNKLSIVWLLHYFRLLVGSFLYIFLIPIAALKYGTRTQRKQILVEYGLLGLAYFLILFITPFEILLHVWLIPLLLVAYMTNIRGLVQHGHTNIADPFLDSRSIRANPIIAFCLLYENYHLEHHLFPEVPSYNLKKLHQLLWPRLPHAITGSSYTGFLAQFFRATPTMDETPIGFETINFPPVKTKHVV